MAMTETQLKECIKNGDANLYVLYGAEGYLVEQYARMIARETVEEGFDAFNLQRFDGQEVTIAELEDAVEALPLMTDRKCVLVRDLDPSGAESDRLLSLMEQVPDSCVLVFWQMTVQPDSRKNAWKSFLKMDLLIAATAITNNFTLVTHNMKHFENIPNLKVEDWF